MRHIIACETKQTVMSLEIMENLFNVIRVTICINKSKLNLHKKCFTWIEVVKRGR